MPARGICGWLCCTRGFRLLAREHGAKDEGEEEEEESFELRNQEERVMSNTSNRFHTAARPVPLHGSRMQEVSSFPAYKHVITQEQPNPRANERAVRNNHKKIYVYIKYRHIEL